MSLTIDSVLQKKPSHRLRIGLWLIVVALVAGVFWAQMTELPRVVRGNLIIEPVGDVQKVQHPDGGRLAELLVNEGDRVEQGQVLLRIDRTRATSSLDENLSRQRSLERQIARLRQESQGLAFESDRPELADEVAANQARVEALNREQGVLREKITGVDAQLNANQSAVAAGRDAVASAKEELAQFKTLQASGAVSRVEVLRLERELREREASLSQLRSERPRLNSEKQALTEQIQALESEFRSKARQELLLVQTELDALRSLSAGITDRVQATEVLAPTSGVLSAVLVNTIGQVVSPGDTLMEIVPGDSVLQASVEVAPSDIGFVALGQPVSLRISTYDFSRYGVLKGSVARVGANTIETRDKEPFYAVTVELDKTYLGSQSAPLPVKVGMRGIADVETGQRTVLGYFLTPINKMRYEALTER